MRAWRIALIVIFTCVSLRSSTGAPSSLAADGSPLPIAGGWTLNTSAEEPAGGDTEHGGERGRGRGRGGDEGGGSGRRGGFRGGAGGGGMNRGGGRGGDPAAMMRQVNAMREIFDAPRRLTITATDTTVIITSDQGRTTRLALDGSKVKDESTGIERRTRWDGAKLTTEITGAGPNKIVQTYAVDPDSNRLIISLQTTQSHGAPAGTRRHVYDALADPPR